MPNPNCAANLRHDSNHQADAARARSANSLPGRIRKLIAMQDVLLARVLDPATSSKDCAACSCAYDRIEERIRVLRGEGAPKTVTAKNDPDAKPRRKQPITEAKPAE